ncbi:MAG: hypothetical protein JWM83_2959 [Candidatus Angelobacter sp.]|nr:hypothetical protein [Candidatus Angelobacter sp.]
MDESIAGFRSPSTISKLEKVQGLYAAYRKIYLLLRLLRQLHFRAFQLLGNPGYVLLVHVRGH